MKNIWNKIENKYEIYLDYAELIINSNKYGEFRFKIDLDDLERIKIYQWSLFVTRQKNKTDDGVIYYYAEKRNPHALLHRFITNADKTVLVDHIDRNTLNNTKSNLRFCTKSQNAINKKMQNNNKSGCPGVYWSDSLVTPKWKAFMMLNRKYKHLGYFDNFEDAVKIRKEAEIKYFGEFKSNDY